MFTQFKSDQLFFVVVVVVVRKTMEKNQLATRVIGGPRNLQLALLIEIRAGLGGRGSGGRKGVRGYFTLLYSLPNSSSELWSFRIRSCCKIQTEFKCHVSLDYNLATKSVLFLLSHRANVNSLILIVVLHGFGLMFPNHLASCFLSTEPNRAGRGHKSGERVAAWPKYICTT